MAALRADAPLDLRTPAGTLVVVRAQLGDRTALNDVLCALEGPLWSHIRLLVRDDDLARDVLQEVMLTIARKLGSLRDPRWLRAWAVRVATRHAVRQAARAKRRVDQPTDDDDLLETMSVPVNEPPFEPELIAAVPGLVAALPPACQIVVRLRYLDEMSVAEIAEALEIPEGTVKSRLMYGLTRLRESAVALPR